AANSPPESAGTNGNIPKCASRASGIAGGSPDAPVKNRVANNRDANAEVNAARPNRMRATLESSDPKTADAHDIAAKRKHRATARKADWDRRMGHSVGWESPLRGGG